MYDSYPDLDRHKNGQSDPNPDQHRFKTMPIHNTTSFLFLFYLNTEGSRQQCSGGRGGGMIRPAACFLQSKCSGFRLGYPAPPPPSSPHPLPHYGASPSHPLPPPPLLPHYFHPSHSVLTCHTYKESEFTAKRKLSNN